MMALKKHYLLSTYVMRNSEALQKKIAWDYKHKSKGQKYFAKALKKFTLMHSNQLDLTYKSIKNQFGVSYPIQTYSNEV